MEYPWLWGPRFWALAFLCAYSNNQFQDLSTADASVRQLGKILVNPVALSTSGVT